MKNRGWTLAIGLLLSSPVMAIEWEWGEAAFNFKNTLSIGAAVRMQQPSNDLIGKTNLTPGLCAPDDCLSLNGDPGPNQRLVDAPGAFFGVNGDDGNLNYDQYDIVAGATKLNTDFKVEWGEFLARTRVISFVDPVNLDFEDRHPDTRWQPARSERGKGIEKRFALGAELYEAYVQYAFQIGERAGVFAVGNQYLRWGESNLLALNSLNEISPPNANLLRLPGGIISEVFQPVPMVFLSTDVVPDVSLDLMYQLGWRKTEPDARGSFFSDSDIVGGGEYAIVGLGQFSEDPDRQFTFAGPLSLVSSTTVTVYPVEIEAPNEGQYGARLNYYAEWLNGGTELSLYFLNYHSRLPLVSVIATEDSCLRDATDSIEAFQMCDGFNGSLPRLPGQMGGEPLPIDTLTALIEYPEDIRMFGFSFNTNLGDFSLSAEYAYRPNLPVQVHIPDVVFAGVQPAFPANEIQADPTGLGALLETLAGVAGLPFDEFIAGLPGGTANLGQFLTATFPAADVAVPSFVRDFRGIQRVAPGQYIAGFERLKVGNFGATLLRAFSDNPVGADQLIFLTEVGFTHILDMPDRAELQLEGYTLMNTSAKPGADGTGQPDGEPDPRTLNPTQQTRGFADSFSWGVRQAILGEYNDVVFGWNFKPAVGLYWDINGVAPFPMQNFVEGRREFLAGTDINFNQDFSARVIYQWFTGAGSHNTRRDRDNLAISFSYVF